MRAGNEFHFIAAKNLQRKPWKNGCGFQREVFIWPKDASIEKDNFHWRVSYAEISRSSPFSVFPGCDRLLLLTTPGSVTIKHKTNPILLTGDAVFRAPCEDATACELAGPSVIDIGLLYRRDRYKADLQSMRGNQQKLERSFNDRFVIIALLEGELKLSVVSENKTHDFQLYETGDALVITNENADKLLVRDSASSKNWRLAWASLNAP